MSGLTCPKCGAPRPAAPEPAAICPACGLVFAKYAEAQARRAQGRPALVSRRPQAAQEDETGDNGLCPRVMDDLFPPPQAADRSKVVGGALLLAALLVWGLWFAQSDWREGEACTSFLHQANLAFHEFGHVLFRPFGEWMMFLGGSLFQCLLPLVLCGVFVFRQHDPLGGAVALWWAGQNLVDVAPYIGDARALALPLVGEYTEEIADAREFRHDWHNLLSPLGLLEWDHRLAALAHWGGVLVMALALAWGARWLWRCHRTGEAD